MFYYIVIIPFHPIFNILQNSFDDTVHFDDICAPLKPELVKNKVTTHVTTANLATAQVAISTITTGEKDDKAELSKKLHKIMASAGGSDKSPTDFGTSAALAHKTTPTSVPQKCSVQEGVRMMVTSSMLGQPKAQAILNPPANVQKAIVVTQNTSVAIPKAKESTVSKVVTCFSSNQPKTDGELFISFKGRVIVAQTCVC